MEKDHLGSNLSLNGNRREEHLEISTTGYGLESVTTSTLAESQQNAKKEPSRAKKM
ncbi:MAG TPA: hypothetical protein VEY70_08275 [Metabacillus sp.]|nr:hypothetical protein [Metabacillus sp.]